MTKAIHKPYDKFKGWLRENKLTYSDIADFLGINVSTVSQKINGQSDFLLSEINAMKEHYGLPGDIFFTSVVA